MRILLSLYNSKCPKNQIHKDPYLEVVYSVEDDSFKEQISMTDLSINVLNNEYNFIYKNPNYAKIDVEVDSNTKYTRYYFINSINWVSGQVFRLDLHVDVLMTYKADIEKLNCWVDRISDPMYIDPLIVDNELVQLAEPIDSYILIEKGETGKLIDSTLPPTQEGAFNILLNVVRGVEKKVEAQSSTQALTEGGEIK